MQDYWQAFLEGYTGYFNYLRHEIAHPSWNNYFYWLLAVSLFFFLLEVIIPWRKGQAIFRKDFWLDAFYMFFNFFLFSLIVYSAVSNVVVNLFNDGISFLTGGFDLQAVNPMNDLPFWAVLLIGFVVRDFVQWWIHRLLHRSDRLWEFHKVHHSVAEMGFAAHLRYHWMENIVYRTLEYIPLALLGIGLYDFFLIHLFTLAWGHYNHANVRLSGRVTGGIVGALIGILVANGLLDIQLVESPSLVTKIAIVSGSSLLGVALGGGMKYLFNSPEMHIWHHARELPEARRFGVNFGLTLSVWDYLFGTAYIPHDGREIALGFPGVEQFPAGFGGQVTHGFAKKDEAEPTQQQP